MKVIGLASPRRKFGVRPGQIGELASPNGGIGTPNSSESHWIHLLFRENSMAPGQAGHVGISSPKRRYTYPKRRCKSLDSPLLPRKTPWRPARPDRRGLGSPHRAIGAPHGTVSHWCYLLSAQIRWRRAMSRGLAPPNGGIGTPNSCHRHSFTSLAC